MAEIQLYVQVLEPVLDNDTFITATVESIFPLFMYQYLELHEKVNVFLVYRPDNSKIGIDLDVSKISFKIENSSLSWITSCELPSLFKCKDNVGFSGICCVCR